MKLQGHIANLLPTSANHSLTVISHNFYFETRQNWNFFVCKVCCSSSTHALLGHIANVWLTKYRMLKCAIVFQWIGGVAVSLCFLTAVVVALATYPYHTSTAVINPHVAYLFPLLLVSYTVCILSGGVFESNAIQFGLDQLHTRGSQTKTDHLHPLLESECWRIGTVLLFSWLNVFHQRVIPAHPSSIIDTMFVFIFFL